MAAVQYLEGEEVWRAAEEGRWSRKLMDAALYRSLPRSLVETRHSWTDEQVEEACARLQFGRGENLEEKVEKPVALLVEYRDGFRAACINLTGYITSEFTVAVRKKGGEVASTLFFLGGGPQSAYHGVQVHHIEDLFLNRKGNYPVKRTLLTGGALSFLMDSRVQGHRRIETPEL